MGEASRKRARLEAQRKELESAVEKVSHALIFRLELVLRPGG